MSTWLSAICALIPQCGLLLDVGCDHGKLAEYAALSGLCGRVIASDVSPGSLQKAEKRLARYANAETRLGWGLRVLRPEEDPDVIVIAGMGGETISAILSAAPWTRNGHMLLLQPMTKAADLRHWLADNGYTFTAECLVEDKGRVYPILTVTGGAHHSLTEAEALCGVLLEGDPLYGA